MRHPHNPYNPYKIREDIGMTMSHPGRQTWVDARPNLAPQTERVGRWYRGTWPMASSRVTNAPPSAFRSAAQRGTAGTAEVMTVQPAEAKCSWCGQELQLRRGGSPQRFCSTKHRSLFWSTLRRWGARAVAAGIVTIADIRNGDPTACTLPGAPISRPPASAERQDCISDNFSRLLDEMDGILGEPTIELLIRLGWLTRDR